MASPTKVTRALEDTHAGRALVRAVRLRVTGGPDRGATLRPDGDRAIVGTHPSAHLVLTDAAVSRFHCEIQVDGAVARIRDLGSRNGTRVDGVRVVDAFLPDRASIQVGQSRLRFELGRDSLSIAFSSRDHFGALVGASRAMRAVYPLIEAAAASDATVLLTGETGTGKDLAVQSIHDASGRSGGPFVVVDCGSVVASLAESQLFGHERGAFTGADRRSMGAFERASGGTLFLDEIGELPAEVQPKLLRALESRTVTRVGGRHPIAIDTRVVCATHRDLRAEVNVGRFRADLYYRLAVLTIRMPALRDRLDDLPVLVDAIVDGLGMADEPAARRLRRPAQLAALAAHSWPGNVRELRNHVERAVLLRRDPPLEDRPAPEPIPSIDASMPLREARERWSAAFERRYLEALLRAHGDNVAAAARAAGVDRVHLHRLLSRVGLR